MLQQHKFTNTLFAGLGAAQDQSDAKGEEESDAGGEEEGEEESRQVTSSSESSSDDDDIGKLPSEDKSKGKQTKDKKDEAMPAAAVTLKGKGSTAAAADSEKDNAAQDSIEADTTKGQKRACATDVVLKRKKVKTSGQLEPAATNVIDKTPPAAADGEKGNAAQDIIEGKTTKGKRKKVKTSGQSVEPAASTKSDQTPPSIGQKGPGPERSSPSSGNSGTAAAADSEKSNAKGPEPAASAGIDAEARKQKTSGQEPAASAGIDAEAEQEWDFEQDWEGGWEDRDCGWDEDNDWDRERSSSSQGPPKVYSFSSAFHALGGDSDSEAVADDLRAGQPVAPEASRPKNMAASQPAKEGVGDLWEAQPAAPEAPGKVPKPKKAVARPATSATPVAPNEVSATPSLVEFRSGGGKDKSYIQAHK